MKITTININDEMVLIILVQYSWLKFILENVSENTQIWTRLYRMQCHDRSWIWGDVCKSLPSTWILFTYRVHMSNRMPKTPQTFSSSPWICESHRSRSYDSSGRLWPVPLGMNGRTHPPYTQGVPRPQKCDDNANLRIFTHQTYGLGTLLWHVYPLKGFPKIQ